MWDNQGVTTMAKKRVGKTVPVRLTEEAIRWRSASGLTEESAAEYISRVVVERGMADFEKLSEEIKSQKPKPPKR